MLIDIAVGIVIETGILVLFVAGGILYLGFWEGVLRVGG